MEAYHPPLNDGIKVTDHDTEVAMKIEDAASQLVNLADKSTLSKAELTKARQIMVLLKSSGMSNEEISALSKGKWSESTIKGYVKGTKATDPSLWQDALALLEEVISTGLSLDEVEAGVAVFEDLKSKGLSTQQAVDLLVEAQSAAIDIKALIKQHEELRACNLLSKDVAEALALKEKLAENGLELHSLSALVELAGNFGNAEEVLEVVSTYGELSEIRGQIEAAKAELKSWHEQLSSAGQRLSEIEARFTELKQPLEAYEKAVKMGFTEDKLATLCTLAQKYSGVDGVLQAVKAHTNYAEIINKISKAKTAVGDTKAEIDKLETEYGHLKTATTMCNRLVQQYNFGMDAIATIFSVAKKYGEPVDVLKAVESYGKLQFAQQELSKLEGKVAERKELANQLEGQFEEVLSQLESLNAMALKVGAEVAKVESKLQESKGLHKVMNLINDPSSVGYTEYGPLVTAMAASIRKWVVVHEQRFKYSHNIKSGLDDLIAGLGGA